MISDKETNFLYLADTLPLLYPNFFGAFQKLLLNMNINYALLPHTKDVWAVDYMPIQIKDDSFIQFRYRPSYLTYHKKWKQTISDVDSICKAIQVYPQKSEIVLDGGNLMHSSNKAILTERVFSENPSLSKNKILNELYEILNLNSIYVIPELPNDFTGHADGMLRFMNENTLIINDFRDENYMFQKGFESAIKKTKLDYVIIPRNVRNNKTMDEATGEYINYLEMKKGIILPAYNIKEDEAVFKLFTELFPQQSINMVISTDLAKNGGVLNCISWNIKL